jgi:hypothetical protein
MLHSSKNGNIGWQLMVSVTGAGRVGKMPENRINSKPEKCLKMRTDRAGELQASIAQPGA